MNRKFLLSALASYQQLFLELNFSHFFLLPSTELYDVLFSKKFYICLYIRTTYGCTKTNKQQSYETRIQDKNCHFSLKWTLLLTWNLRIMVHMRPRVSLELPSTISCAPMFSKCTRCSCKNVNALSTFSKQWILILPLVGRG